MKTKNQSNAPVTHIKTNQTGRLLGPFVRKGENWWTIFWEDGETTAEREEDIK